MDPNPTASALLRRMSRLRPTLAIVLGSGFHSLADALRSDASVPYSKLPGFPRPRVAGHAGTAHLGHLGDVPVLLLSGRAHFYEGHDMDAVTFPIRTLNAFGIRDVLLTNAAGGINRWYRPGDFMMLTDHINLMGSNPLRDSEAHPTAPDSFLDLSDTYDPKLRKLMQAAARSTKVRLRQGVYVAVPGPTYETPAEIRAFGKLGADAIGMSTVPEAIVARHCRMRVLGLSCITNAAAGIRKGEALRHQDVLEAGQQAAPAAAKLLIEFARRYAEAD
jgi:purine-nucleoside phosphorylase